MTPERQQVVIAELSGWTDCKIIGSEYWFGIPAGQSNRGDNYRMLPDYLNSLDAMQKAENSIPQPSDFYRHTLIQVCGSELKIHLATAAERAEAFLRVFNRWEDAQ